jgi:hypothetical protein
MDPNAPDSEQQQQQRLHYPPHVQTNQSRIYATKFLTSCFAGAAAGILGLENFRGFGVFFFATLLSSALLWLRCKGSPKKYVPGGLVELVNPGQENLFSFLLVWTLFYGSPPPFASGFSQILTCFPGIVHGEIIRSTSPQQEPNADDEPSVRLVDCGCCFVVLGIILTLLFYTGQPGLRGTRSAVRNKAQHLQNILHEDVHPINVASVNHNVHYLLPISAWSTIITIQHIRGQDAEKLRLERDSPPTEKTSWRGVVEGLSLFRKSATQITFVTRARCEAAMRRLRCTGYGRRENAIEAQMGERGLRSVDRILTSKPTSNSSATNHDVAFPPARDRRPHR